LTDRYTPDDYDEAEDAEDESYDPDDDDDHPDDDDRNMTTMLPR